LYCGATLQAVEEPLTPATIPNRNSADAVYQAVCACISLQNRFEPLMIGDRVPMSVTFSTVAGLTHRNCVVDLETVRANQYEVATLRLGYKEVI
jgi:hypothetical protein